MIGYQCCPYGAINVTALPTYDVNLSAALARFDAGFPTCTCGPEPAPPLPCCAGGTCQVGSACAGTTTVPDIDGSDEDVVTLADRDATTDANPCGQIPPGCARALNASLCQAGFVCNPTQGCAPSECSCDPLGRWSCSADCGGGVCVPGPDAGGSSATCPSAEPQVGGLCDGPIACPYMGLCGSDLWICSASKSYWAATQRATCSGACSVAEPKQGDACMAGGKCSYRSACGSQDTVYCDGTGTVMRIDYGSCPACPIQEPTPLTTCVGSLSCMFTNSCGGTDVASCSAEAWTVLRGDCEN